MDCPRCGGSLSQYRLGDAETVACDDCIYVGVAVDHTSEPGHRESWTEALDRFEAGDTTLARGGFNDAATELQTSVDHFRTAARQATSDDVTDPCERARDKATCLWQAVEWLSGATYAAEQGDRSQANRYKNDATQRLQASREYGELPDPETLSA